MEEYPLKPHELLRDRSDRVFDRLSVLANRDPHNAARPVWLIDGDGAIEVVTLGELADKKERDQINHRTVLLPPSAGGLRGGLLDGNSDEADDVADQWLDLNGHALRLRVWDDGRPDGMRLVQEIDTKPTTEEDDEAEAELATRRIWRWYEKPKTADSE